MMPVKRNSPAEVATRALPGELGSKSLTFRGGLDWRPAMLFPNERELTPGDGPGNADMAVVGR